MGMFKQMKSMKNMVAAAPGLMDQAQQINANAQIMQAQAAAQQQAVAHAPAAHSGALDPIAGVSLQQYAVIVRAIAPLNYDQSALPGIAAAHGIDGASWQLAHDGWNARIQGEPAVARAFSDIYRGV